MNYGTRSIGHIAAALMMGVLLCVFPSSSKAQTFEVLHAFTGLDGGFPDATVTFDMNGNLYGTTFDGTVYEIDSTGTFSVLHTFSHHEGTSSESTLLVDSAGNLYGTNSQGGSKNLGTAFRLNKSGQLILLVSWGKFGDTSHGWDPTAGLTTDKTGALYGTTQLGGASDFGTVYEVDHGTGAFTLLHSFGVPPDGAEPNGRVLLGADDSLYGTTQAGGQFGPGTIFKIDVNGMETTLYSFSGGADGANPTGDLAQDIQGNLYSTTYQGGNANAGTVFKFDQNTATLTTLYSFSGTDGANPFSGVVIDQRGNLYGTTYGGGANIWGTAYKLDTSGNLTILHNFSKGTDGGLPYAGVTLYKGSIYGTTQQGGAFGYGVVYKVTP